MSISEAESVVMEALWRDGPSTADKVTDAVAKQQQWSSATVKTLLNRLLKKEVIKAKRDGRKYIYAAVVTRMQYVAHQSQSLVDRLFDGRIAPLVSHFSKQQKLSPEDIAELKRLIAELENNG